MPRFAHVPLILGPDKKRLSKRHGATSVMEYARQGYLPEAMVNFLALLGWSPGGDQRAVHARRAGRRSSTLEGISGGNAVFNPEKLDWFNQQHIVAARAGRARARDEAVLEAAGLWNDELSRRSARVVLRRARAAEAAREAARRFRRAGRVLLHAMRSSTTPRRSTKHLRVDGMDEHLAAIDAAFARLEDVRSASLEAALRAVAEARGVKAGCADSRRTGSGHRKNGKPRTVRGARAARAGIAHARAPRRRGVSC